MPGRKKCRKHAERAHKHALERAVDLERRKGNQDGETKRQARKRANKLRSIIAGGGEPRPYDPERAAKKLAEHEIHLEARRQLKKLLRLKRKQAWYREHWPDLPVPES